MTVSSRPSGLARALAASLLPLALSSLLCAQTPGSIIAIGDEWLLSDHAFTHQSTQTTQLALNIADYFTGGQPGGNFLVLSDIAAIPGFGERGVQGPMLASVMQNAGHIWTIDPLAALTVQNLAQYDGVFLAGSIGSGAANAAVLTSYINAGGSALVMVGVGGGPGGFNGGAAVEAAAWNHLLGNFGLEFGPTYFATPPSGLLTIPVEPTTHSLGTNLASVIWGYGHVVLDLDPGNPSNQIAVRGDFLGYGGPQGRWNSIIATYNLGTVAAGYQVFGAGCPGTAGVPSNSASALPALGQTMVVDFGNLPAPEVVFIMLGFSRTTSSFGPLPLDLAPFGAPGCQAFVSPDFVGLLLGANGTAAYTWTLPSGQNALGLRFYSQGLVVDPGAGNSLGAILSDAAAATIGN